MNNQNDKDLWQLHVRSVQDEPLTPAETQQLQAWYEAQDKIEMAQLKIVQEAPALSTQINETLGHIALVTQNIKRLTEENDALRQEIAALRHQLAQQRALQPA